METWPTIAALPQPNSFKAEFTLHDEPGPVSGLYCLWGARGDLLYVGQSTNIVRRLGEHRAIAAGRERRRAEQNKPSHSLQTEEFTHATWYPCGDYHTRLQLEGILILAALPSHNRLLYLGIAPGGVYEVGYRTPRPKEGTTPRAKVQARGFTGSQAGLGKRAFRHRKASS